jgi:hypothetical protein
MQINCLTESHFLGNSRFACDISAMDFRDPADQAAGDVVTHGIWPALWDRRRQHPSQSPLPSLVGPHQKITEK